jgi:hypothetical protein
VLHRAVLLERLVVVPEIQQVAEAHDVEHQRRKWRMYPSSRRRCNCCFGSTSSA